MEDARYTTLSVRRPGAARFAGGIVTACCERRLFSYHRLFLDARRQFQIQICFAQLAFVTVATRYHRKHPHMIYSDILGLFIDCPVLLAILLKWGRSDFQPQPRDIVHLDVLVPLLTELRSWTETVLLVKVESHAGCLLNERADSLAFVSPQT